jgi:hypothetical protein
MTQMRATGYRPTESKYKGGAEEMYVTYDLEQRTRSGTAVYPRVKRVYIAGKVKDWKVGDFTKRTGRRAHGVRVEYEQTRDRHHRSAYTAHRGGKTYTVKPAEVKSARQSFTQVVEVPERARNVQFTDELPPRYREALQDVR